MNAAFATWSTVIQIHTIAAVLALCLGPFALWRKKRDRWHRWAGFIWITLMLVVATSAWFIHTLQLIGPFSPIHLFSLWTYWAIFQALRHVRAGRYRAHGAEMRALYLWALGVAGLFTLLPGRHVHQLLFGEHQAMSIAVMFVLGGCLVAILRHKPRLAIVR